jgi:TonB family protein
VLKREVANGQINPRTDGKRGLGGAFVVLSHALSEALSEALSGTLSGVLSGALVMSVLLSPSPTGAQSYDQISSERKSERKVITRVEPEYPDALKRLYIGGAVRVEVLVAPNGVVKSTKLLGGSPILGQSSMKALKQWRYAPATADEVLTVKFEFDPHR